MSQEGLSGLLCVTGISHMPPFSISNSISISISNRTSEDGCPTSTLTREVTVTNSSEAPSPAGDPVRRAVQRVQAG